MRRMILLCLFVAGLVGGCSQPTITETVSDEFAAQGLQRVTSSGFDQAYVHPDANLPRYNGVVVAPLGAANVEISQTAVSGTARSQWALTGEREQALQALWASATTRAFSDYPLDESGKPALRLESDLTHITPGRTSGSATTAGGQVVLGSADSVDVAAEFRLYDDASGQLLAVIRDRRTLPGLSWTRMAGSDLANQFSRWAGLLHTRISGR